MPTFNGAFSQPSNQLQNPSSSAPPPQQAMSSNPNTFNVLHNSFPIQPQYGTNSAQLGNCFTNGVAIPNVPNSMINQPGFINFPNNLIPLQNNYLGMPHLGSVGHMSQLGNPQMGFGPQNIVNNLNSAATFPVYGQLSNFVQDVNQVRPSHLPGQAFGQNGLNLPQQVNQSLGFPFGQLCLPNPLQNVNQYMPMQMSNPSQFVPQDAVGAFNQALQATGSQNAAFLGSQQFGNVHCNQARPQVNQNQHNLLPPVMGVNSMKSSAAATQHMLGNLCAASTSSSQPMQSNDLQPPMFTSSEENPTRNLGYNNSNSNWKNQTGKNFNRNPRRGAPHGGFQNSQSHRMRNGKQKFGFSNGHTGKGLGNERAGKLNQGREQKRPLLLTYTKQEIQQWREERRKNYPSKANIEKKLNAKLRDAEVLERETKTRHEQLQEILAKQAELGVEVAEIPGLSLSDSKKQVHGREENRKQLNKKGRPQNKFDKRGRCNKNDRLPKKRRLHDNASSDFPSLSRRKPTLLQKLLSADLRRDKNHLLQVFRFMVINSFLKDCPDKPLKFPSMIAKVLGVGDEVVEKMSSHAENNVYESSNRSSILKDEDDNDGSDDNGCDADGICEDDNNVCEDNDGEEEGEIIN